MQIGNSIPNLILLLISSEISRHGDNWGMGNVIFLLLFNDSALSFCWLNTSLHFARLCCVCLIIYLLIC